MCVAGRDTSYLAEGSIMQIMRIAVLLLGFGLGVVFFVQAFVLAAIASTSGDGDIAVEGGIGVLMAVIWVLAAALVFPVPWAAMLLFGLVGLVGLVVADDYGDLAVWGGLSLGLATLSFFGWWGNHRTDLAALAALAVRVRPVVSALGANLRRMRSGQGPTTPPMRVSRPTSRRAGRQVMIARARRPRSPVRSERPTQNAPGAVSGGSRRPRSSSEIPVRLSQGQAVGEGDRHSAPSLARRRRAVSRSAAARKSSRSAPVTRPH